MTKRDKTCKFSRKSSFSSYVQHKNRKPNNQFNLSCVSWMWEAGRRKRARNSASLLSYCQTPTGTLRIEEFIIVLRSERHGALHSVSNCLLSLSLTCCLRPLFLSFQLSFCVCGGGGEGGVACVLAFVSQETRTLHISPKSAIAYFWLLPPVLFLLTVQSSASCEVTTSRLSV